MFVRFEVKHLVWLFVLALVSACQADKPEQFRLTVIQMNDIYEISPVNGGREGGLARVGYYIDSVRRENPNTLVVHAGDYLNPSLIGNLKGNDGNRIRGKHMVEVMNTLGLDAVTFGNHEFDIKETELRSRLEETEFPMVSCNVSLVSGIDTLPFTVQGSPIPKKLEHQFIDGADTVHVELIGVTLPYNRKHFVRYEDVNASIAASLNPHSDLQLLLTHQNRSEDSVTAAMFQQVPLIMGGHDHYHFIDTVGNTFIAKADANARTVWRHDLSRIEGVWKVQSNLIRIDEAIPEKESVKAVVEKWEDFARDRTSASGFDMSKVVLETDINMDARETVIRSQATEAGRWICEAMLWSDERVELALLNSGSVRYDDLLPNTITQGDVLKLLPFGGGLKIAQVKGDLLIRKLELGTTVNKGSGAYLQILGASLNGGTWQIKDEPIDPLRSYWVAAPEYLASGREKNMGEFASLTWIDPSKISNGSLENDIRKILIAFCLDH